MILACNEISRKHAKVIFMKTFNGIKIIIIKIIFMARFQGCKESKYSKCWKELC